MGTKRRVAFRLAGWSVTAAALVVFVTGAPAALAADEKPHVEVYGFVQADYVQDFNRVHPDWDDTLRPSRIPTTDGFYGDDGQAIVSARQSRLGVIMNLPTANKPVYTKFEFDMYGVGEDEGKTTIRLRHAYGEWGHWLAGQTNSLFMDASIFPNVVDYWGPNGMVFLRTPQVRWTPVQGSNSFAIALERPSNDIDTGDIRIFDPNLPSGIQASETVPDLTGQFRSTHDWGHYQIAGIARRVSYDTANTPNNEPKDSDLGWGLDATTGIKTVGKDKFLFGVVYGEGIATYMNDGGMDLAPELKSATGATVSARGVSVPLMGVSAYYDHYWSDKYATSVGYSQVQVENTDLQSNTAFYLAQYASVNLLCYPTQNVMLGAEALWGQREDNAGTDPGDLSGANGHDLRLQFTFHYSFSTKDVFKKN